MFAHSIYKLLSVAQHYSTIVSYLENLVNVHKDKVRLMVRHGGIEKAQSGDRPGHGKRPAPHNPNPPVG